MKCYFEISRMLCCLGLMCLLEAGVHHRRLHELEYFLDMQQIESDDETRKLC